MPKRKGVKRKVKPVKLPKGEEGSDLSLEDKQAKLDSFLEQFDHEVEERLKELDKECQAICQHIESAATSLSIKLTPEEAKMPVSEYFRKLRKADDCGRTERADTDSLSNCDTAPLNLPPHLEAIISGLDIASSKPNNANADALTKSKQALQSTAKRRVPGFATPAAAYRGAEPMWTATPQQTPLFDKKLLNICTGKRTGLSLNGQALDSMSIKGMKSDDRQQLSILLMGVINELKSEK